MIVALSKKKLLVILFILVLSLEAKSQEYEQLYNYDFESWVNVGSRDEEPYHWHSFKTSTGPFHYLLMQQVERHEATRPGSKGKYSARIFSRSIVGIVANGNITNGRLNAGSMFPAGKKNNNYTQRASEYCKEIGTVPDSLTAWVCLRTKDIESYGRLMSYVHGDADFVCFTGGWKPYEMICAQVEYEFPRTSSKDEMIWKRVSLPYKHYPELCNEPRYILTSFTTNKYPGDGDAGDEMFVDDLYLIYNPSLDAEIRNEELGMRNEVEIEYMIKGTMSPPNLNIPPNEVIVVISLDEDFKNAVEIGRKTTDVSGNIKCRLPDNIIGKKYFIKVMTTNYPMETVLKSEIF